MDKPRLQSSSSLRVLRLTRVWLCLVGGVQALAIFAVFMPKSWMDLCSHWMGVEPLPAIPLAGYLARLSSAMYMVHASTLFMVAYQLPKSVGLVRPLGIVSLMLGLVMLWIDRVEQMPIRWTTIETGALCLNGLIFACLGGSLEKRLERSEQHGIV